MMVAGLDEAGRGSVLGPLVIAGVLMKGKELEKLRALGVRDSKLLTREERAELYPKIVRMASMVRVERLKPREIDSYVRKEAKHRKLNYLEAITMAKIIDELRPDIAYIDAADVNARRFRRQVLESMGHRPKLSSRHRADSLYPIVSAASIVAKVERDRDIERLAELYGPLGSGYSSDPRTRSFLFKWIREKGSLPEFCRKSWSTIRRLRQMRMDEF